MNIKEELERKLLEFIQDNDFNELSDNALRSMVDLFKSLDKGENKQTEEDTQEDSELKDFLKSLEYKPQ